MPTTPLFLLDNVFDSIAQYVTATLDASSETAGREAYHIADGRRDRSSWLPTSDGGASPGNWVRVDLTAAVTRAVDFLWLDRGHNLWGKTITVEGGPDGTTWNVSQARAVPALDGNGNYVAGGDPTTGVCVTEEGALYTLFAALAARRWWRFRVNYVAAFTPLVTGVMMGTRHQLLGYASSRDEDAGTRTQRSETSDAGYLASGPVYSWRTLSVPYRLIGATEYDSTIRDFRRRLFEAGVPVFAATDYVAKPERGWLYTWDGTAFSSPMARVYRDLTMPLRETGAKAR